jgi:Zn-dependent protease with chaperone function
MRFRRHQEAAQQSTRRLLVLFVLVVVGLVLAVNAALAGAYWLMVPFARGLPEWFFETNTGLVLLFVLGGCYVESLRLAKGGGPHVAELAGARPAQPGGHDEASRRERRYVNVVQEMALASGQRPAPAAWLLPHDDAINALAAGWGADDAVVVVTRGALERLKRAELQGVVAHEFSHLVHGDTRLNMRLVGLVWGLQMVWGLGQSLWAADEYGRRHAGALFGLALLAVGSLGWLAGRLLQAAVSRQREFLADASAVKFARHVDGLGGALRKIADQQVRRVAALSSAHAASLAHLLLSSRASERRGGWSTWLATHPTLAERLTRLYGREIDADSLLLAADVVPLDDAQDETVGLAPRLPAMEPAAAAQAPESHRHDATQVPAFHDAAEREREALVHIELWHGPGEWQAAMLALSIAPGTPDTAARWRRYHALTTDLGAVSTAVLADVAQLGAAKRCEIFALLLERATAMPPSLRAGLRSAWSTRWHALHGNARPDMAMALRSLLIHRALRPTAQRAERGTLASEAAAVHAATSLFAHAALVGDEARARWLAAALHGLEQAGLPAPRGPGAGLAPALQPARWRTALRTRRLSPMQRPLLVKCWMSASPLPLPGAVAQVLHLCCLWLRVPEPPLLRPETAPTASVAAG